jgi:non-specific serine/threonine protein kinase
VGRKAELPQIRDLLRSQRLLTLTGPGGIGKTRLGLEAATQARESYPNGVWLVELADLADPRLVPQAVAAPLGIRAVAQAPLEQILVDALRTRHLLLVLDNCEHLVEACATLVEALLRGCPDLRILSTSREPLRVGGETTWRVPPLSVPATTASASPTDLVQYEAVRLFVDRASASAAFSLTEHNAAAVVQLCQQLDGIPLAIELAAARTRVLTPQQIAARLDERFQLLVGGSRTAPPRQQALRASIDWSYDLLPAAERLLLNRLSVFAGGWTLDAAEAVCPDAGLAQADVLSMLGALVDKSLVFAEPAFGGQMRYRLLESVRQYGEERLAEHGSLQAVRQRHCGYFSALAQSVESHVLWGADDVEWPARLDPEQPNLRAALGWSLSDAEAGDPALGLKLVGYLGHYWYTRADRAEGRVWLDQALVRTADAAASADADFRSAHAWAVLWAGGLAHGQSQYDEAVPLLGQALAAFEALGNKRGIGWALSFLGYVARARAELATAADLLERAIDTLQSIDDELSLISPLAALGFTVGALGDQQRATRLLECSVALAERTGSKGRLAIASLYLGQVMYAQAQMERARAAFEQGLTLSSGFGSSWGIAECLEGLALVAGADAMPGRAARLLGAAATLRASIGAPVHPVDRADHERTVAPLQAAFGDEAFAAAFATGQAMALADVVDYALGRGQAEPASLAVETAAPAQATRLTRREREVAVLIAHGMTNRQIANTLVIAERTATAHVEHILNKLGFHSRAQVAAWATEHRLPR